MNQRSKIITVCLVVLLALLVLTWVLLSVFAPAENPTTTAPTGTTVPSVPGGNTWLPTDPTQSQPTVPPLPPGEVRLYTCDPALYQVYLDLAETFSSQSEHTVTVLPLREGDCREALEYYLESDTPPTVFCIHDRQTLQALQDRLLELSDSPLCDTLNSDVFALQDAGRIVGLAVDVEAYGLIYNTSLLGKAGFSRDYFTDLPAMENAVRHIMNNRSELGFSPFGTLSFADTGHNGMACRLSLLCRDPDQMRTFLDLYQKNDLASGDATAQFLSGKAAFYLGSTESYQQVSGLVDGTHNLDILPMLYADGGKMHYSCEFYWAFDGAAAPQDRIATEQFMLWMVTAGENGTPVDRLCLMAPFRDATYYENVLQRKLRGYMAAQPGILSFPSCQEVTEAELEALSQALAVYVAAPNDENWAAVAALLTKQNTP